MDKDIDRTELKKEDPALLAEERAEILEETPAPEAEETAAAEPAEAIEPKPAENADAPADDAENASEENKAAPAETDAPAEDEADAPLVMPAPAEAVGTVELPEVPAPAPIPAGPAQKLFNSLSYIGLPVLLIFAAAMSFLEVWQVRDLWFSDETRLADVLMNMKNGDWLVLTLNGAPYPDTPPLYFWFMDALTKIPGLPISVPMALFLAVAISHALFIGSIWALARGTGFDRRVAFASGLVALSCVYISGVATYLNVDLLFAALVTLGMTFLYRGWIKSFAPFWLACGWLLLAAATLTKSPLGIAFAIVSSVLFLFWRWTPGRLNSRDGLPGFFLMLLVLAAWMGVLYLDGHTGYIRAMVEDQLVGRIYTGAPIEQDWWYYLVALPVIWVPWILLPLFVNWFAALRGIPSYFRNRKTEGGSSWLWIWLVTGVAMLTLVQTKNPVYVLPLLAPLAVLTARSLLQLSAGRSRCFFGLSAALFAVVGLALVLFDVFPFIREYLPAEWLAYIPGCMLPWLEALEGTMYVGGVLILTAVALLSLTRLALPGGSLLVTALGMILMLQPYHWFVTPSMGKILSPGTQAAVTADPAPASSAAPAVEEQSAEAAAPAEQPEAAPAEAPAAEQSQPAPVEEPAKAETAPAAPADSAPEAAPAASPAEDQPAPAENAPQAPAAPQN
ncbi:MAG: glycosyltransferase family 39 protein [Mailhella sp.]|nr:glycosyltransferase family 39 protein [Mailhella sp.]